MSKTVVQSVSTTHATFSGNVASVSTSTTEVADLSDISALEARLTNKIEEKSRRFEHTVKELKELIKTYAEENKALKDLLLTRYSVHIEKEKNELYSVYEDIAKKITNS